MGAFDDLVPGAQADVGAFGDLIPEVKPRGMVSAFGAGMGTEAAGFARTLGKVSGLTGVEQWAVKKREELAPTKEETDSIALSVARGVGGLAADLPLIIGTAALLPEAAVGGGITALALRGVAAMTPVAINAGINTGADLADKGVDTGTAVTAGVASAATTAAMGAIPLSLTGGLLKRAGSGAASGMVLGEVQRQSQNAVLGEHPDLQTELTGTAAITNGVVSAMLAGILGPRPIKAAIAKAHADAEADITAGAPLDREAPLEFSKPAPAEKTALTMAEPGARITPPPTEGGMPFERVGRTDLELTPPGTPVLESKPVLPTWQVPTPGGIWDLAKTVKAESATVPKKALAQALQGAKTVEEVAAKLRAQANEWDQAGTRTSDAGVLHAVADHLSPKELGSDLSLEVPKVAPVETAAKADVRQHESQIEIAPVAKVAVKAETFAQTYNRKLAERAELRSAGNRIPARGTAKREQYDTIGDELSAMIEARSGVEAETKRMQELNQTEQARNKARMEQALAETKTSSTEALAGTGLGKVRPLSEVLLGVNTQKVQEANKSAIEDLTAKAQAAHDAGDANAADAYAHQAMLKTIESGPEYQKYLMEEASNKAGEAFLRRGEEATNPTTEANIRAEAEQLFGSKDAVDRNVVFVTDPEKQIPQPTRNWLIKEEARGAGTHTVAFAQNGKMYVFPSRMEAGTERSTILHDVGVHLGMEKLIGKENFTKLAEQIREWMNGNGSPDELAIAAKVVKSLQYADPMSSHIDQETVGYFVQHAVESGINPTSMKTLPQSGAVKWFRKIWSAVQTAVRKLGLDPTKLTAQEIVNLAHSAAVAHVEGVPGVGARGVGVFRSAKAVAPGSVDADKGVKQAFEAVKEVVQTSKNIFDRFSPVSVNTASAALRREWLKWSGVGHIADVVATLKWVPTDRPNSIREISDYMHKGDALQQKLNPESYHIYSMQMRLAPDNLRALTDLKGRYKRAGIFPFLPIKEHTKLGGENMSPQNRRLYNEAKQLFDKPGVAEAYNAERLHNKKLYDMHQATNYRSLAQSEGIPKEIWGPVDVREGLPLDAKGQLKDSPIKTLLEYIAKSSNVNADTRAHFDSMRIMSEANKAPAYFHEARFGDYVTYFKIEDRDGAFEATRDALKQAGVEDQIIITPEDRGNRVFLMFKTENERLAVAKKLEALATAGHVEKGFTTGETVKKLQELDSSAPSFVRAMMDKINADVHLEGPEKTAAIELVRRMYIGMLPEGNASKLYARNAKVGGYSSDMPRAFAEQSAMEAYYISQHSVRPDLAVARADFRETLRIMGDSASKFYSPELQSKATDVYNELNQRVANKLTPVNTPAQDAVNAFGHTFALALSPSYLAQNALQVPQLTWSLLGARHGFVKSAKELALAATDVVKILNDTLQQGWKEGKFSGIADASISIDRATHLSGEDRAAMTVLMETGRAEWTRTRELSAIREGSNPRAERALRVANTLSYYLEVFNRMTSGLAAHRMERGKQGTDKANRYMVGIVDDSQINYSSADQPRAMGKHGVFKSVTPLVLQFQRYNVSVLQTIGKLTLRAMKADTPEERIESKKALAGLLATTTVLAGTMGIPLAGVIAGAYNALAGDEDSPVDFKTDYQNFLADTFGQDVGQVMSHGAFNYISGADVASKVGLENALPFTQLVSQLADSRRKLKDRLDAGAFQFMGPSIGMGAGIAEGMGMVADGNWAKGLEKMSPALVRGAIKAGNMSETGFTTMAGNQIPLVVTWQDIAIQAAGFTPTKLATQREAQQGVNAIQGALRARVSILEQQFADAVESRDLEARLKIQEEIADFRRANPTIAMNLGAVIQKRARERAIALASGAAVKGRATQLPFIQEQTRFVQQP